MATIYRRLKVRESDYKKSGKKDQAKKKT